MKKNNWVDLWLPVFGFKKIPLVTSEVCQSGQLCVLVQTVLQEQICGAFSAPVLEAAACFLKLEEQMKNGLCSPFNRLFLTRPHSHSKPSCMTAVCVTDGCWCFTNTSASVSVTHAVPLRSGLNPRLSSWLPCTHCHPASGASKHKTQWITTKEICPQFTY